MMGFAVKTAGKPFKNILFGQAWVEASTTAEKKISALCPLGLDSGRAYAWKARLESSKKECNCPPMAGSDFAPKRRRKKLTRVNVRHWRKGRMELTV